VLPILLKLLPFFALIACGYFASRSRFFPPAASAVITKFVFYFALPAMLFRLAATLPISDVWNPAFLSAYVIATGALYGFAIAVALARRETLPFAAFEAHCAAIGNVGFLGLPMFVTLYGQRAALPVLMGLAVDLVVFGTLVIVLIEAGRGGKTGLAALKVVARGLATNPMLLSVGAGLLWSGQSLPFPAPVDEFTAILGAAATPCALFAIGCSLAGATAERRQGVAVWLSGLKLFVHPALVALTMLAVFEVDPFLAAIAIGSAAMPTAGNAFLLAQHYEIAVYRVSATILISTAVSIVTLAAVIALVAP
jgi:predicted permease